MDVTHLTPEDLSKRLNISKRTIYRWRETGKGPRGFRAGKHLRWTLAEVEAWEQEQIEKEQAAHAG